MPHNAVAEYWSRELDEPVQVEVNGWREGPNDYSLYISGAFVVAFRHLHEIEDYLGRYFMRRGRM